MDMLVRLLEANDMAVMPGAGRTPAVIQVDGEEIRVILKEHVRGPKREPTQDERRNQESRAYLAPKEFAWDHDATNRFVFEIENYTDSQRRWVDTKHRKIEEDIEQIVRSLLATAAFEKRRRIETEAERRESEQLQRLRYQEQHRIELLKRNIAAWEKAQRIRAYLTAGEVKAAGREDGVTSAEKISRFLEWAHRYADSLVASEESTINEFEGTDLDGKISHLARMTTNGFFSSEEPSGR